MNSLLLLERRDKNGCLQVFAPCVDCGKERWTYAFRSRQPKCARCVSCALKVRGWVGSAHPNWKGGRITDGDGYIYIKLFPDSPYFVMTNNKGYVCEHRLVMAKRLGRPLEPWELVHHKDGDKSHNDDVNLELTTMRTHPRSYVLGYQRGYEAAVAERIGKI